jgi:hypothetical protein
MSNPNIVAHFILDPDGRPKVIETADQKHYMIKLQIKDAPNDTYAVNYRLHESYPDPLRESHNQAAGFAEDLTSYGDYTLQARIRRQSHVQTVASELSQALARGHADSLNPAIEAALKDIADH